MMITMYMYIAGYHVLAMLLFIPGILKMEVFHIFVMPIPLTGLLHPQDLLTSIIIPVHTYIGYCMMDSLMQDILQKVNLFVAMICSGMAIIDVINHY